MCRRCTPTKACGFIYRNSSVGTTPEAKEFRPSPKGHRTLKIVIQDCVLLVGSFSSVSFPLVASDSNFSSGSVRPRLMMGEGKARVISGKDRRRLKENSKISSSFDAVTRTETRQTFRSVFEGVQSARSVSLVNACKRFLAKLARVYE